MSRRAIARGIGSLFNKSRSRASSDLKFDFDNVDDFVKELRKLPEFIQNNKSKLKEWMD